MRYGVAVWNFIEPEKSLAQTIQEIIAIGFDSISLQLHSLGPLEPKEWRALCALVETADLCVTLHTNFVLFNLEHLQRAWAHLGERLYDVTFDPAMQATSWGTLYAAEQMTSILTTMATLFPGLRFGVEDFPLDEEALRYYMNVLQPLLPLPGYGILLDLGHWNIRCHKEPYFQGLNAAEYIRRVPLPIHEIHIHDNDGERDEHRHLGEGTCDFKAAAQGLREKSFAGICTLEVAPALHGATPQEEWEGLAASLHFWRMLMSA